MRQGFVYLSRRISGAATDGEKHMISSMTALSASVASPPPSSVIAFMTSKNGPVVAPPGWTVVGLTTSGDGTVRQTFEHTSAPPSLASRALDTPSVVGLLPLAAPAAPVAKTSDQNDTNATSATTLLQMQANVNASDVLGLFAR